MKNTSTLLIPACPLSREVLEPLGHGRRQSEPGRNREAYLHDPRRPGGAAGRRAESRRADGEKHETRRLLLSDCSFLVLPVCAERAPKRACMRSHTYTHPATRTKHTSPRHTRFSFSCLFLWLRLSVLSFFLSHYLCLLLPSLFQYPLSFSAHAVGFSSRPPAFPLPSHRSPPSRAASPSISLPLSLQCVQSERPLSEPQWARTMEWRRVQRAETQSCGGIAACRKPSKRSSKAPSKEKISPCRYPCLLFSFCLRLCCI